MSGPTPLMTHLVACFPDRERSLRVARAMVAGGASYLEVQFPFSDPSADGTLIQTACSAALSAGFTVDGGFDLVRELHASTEVPIFVMSYANLVYRRGVRAFVEQAREAGARGLIVPDLMPGADEGLFAAGAEAGIEIVPVVAPTISESRLSEVSSVKPRFLYAALRVGITGSYTEIGEENRRFLRRLEPIGAKVLAGFGISTRAQVEALAGEVHALVVGSAFVRIILETESTEQGFSGRGGRDEDSQRLEARIRESVAELVGRSGR